jgi:hypothetical protein
MDPLSAVYLGVLLVSVLLLVAALVFGLSGAGELSHDAELPHDTGLAHGAAAGHVETDGPSWLSTRVILGAAAGFGAFGLGAQAVGLTGWVSVPVAVGGFLIMAVVVRQVVLVPMWRQQSNSLLSRAQYLGSRGHVTLGIRSGETGLVRFLDPNGTPVTDFAVAADGGELPAGTAVLVVDVTAEHVVVDPDPLNPKGK